MTTTDDATPPTTEAAPGATSDPASRVLRFDEVDLQPSVAHGGRGAVVAARALQEQGSLQFVDLVDVPAGTTIGTHTHGRDIELYVIVRGQAAIDLDGAEHRLGPGDVAVNRPGGTHGLRPVGDTPLRMVVVCVDADEVSGLLADRSG